MACRLFHTKPLPEPKLTYFQLDRLEQTAMQFETNGQSDKYELFSEWTIDTL